ncbi:hypothetical protein L0337_03110, partial [candidate division KSB1 bacterium]|nr:hypothetical protein [candidate division KSB1 bacterium]
ANAGVAFPISNRKNIIAKNLFFMTISSSRQYFVGIDSMRNLSSSSAEFHLPSSVTKNHTQNLQQLNFALKKACEAILRQADGGEDNKSQIF